MDLLLAGGIFAIVFVPTMVLLTYSVGLAGASRVTIRRMGPATPAEDLEDARRHRPTSGVLGEWLASIRILALLEEHSWQAGLYIGLGQLVIFLLLLFGVGVAASAFVWHDPIYSLCGGIGLSALPIIYIRFARQHRIKAFSRQLPFALDMIKSSLQAGHTLQRALQVLAAEFTPPLSEEFRTVLEQNRIGLPIARAVEELLRRVPEDNLRLLVIAIKVQSEVGSSLAEIAGRLSELVRSREKLRLQVRALTAQARFGGVMVGVLPFVVLGVFSTIEPNYTRMLLYDPSGREILKIALVMDAVAIVWIRRLLKMRY